MLCFDARKTISAIFLFHVAFWMLAGFRIHDPIHPAIVGYVRFVVVVVAAETAHTCSSSSTPSLALCMSSERVTPSKFAVTFRTDMRTLSSM